MKQAISTWFVASAVAAFWLGGAPPAAAQEEPFHVRGTIEQVDGDSLVVETRDGEVVGLALTDESRMLEVTPATLDEVKAGDYVGLTSIETGGERVAVGAHIFAEDLRGTAEGHFPWDLVEEPNTMTNATVAEVKEVGEQRELTVSYEPEGGEAGTQTIHLPPDVPIAHLRPAADRSVLEAGREVFLIVQGPRDDTPQVAAAVVGTGDAKPPM